MYFSKVDVIPASMDDRVKKMRRMLVNFSKSNIRFAEIKEFSGDYKSADSAAQALRNLRVPNVRIVRRGCRVFIENENYKGLPDSEE